MQSALKKVDDELSVRLPREATEAMGLREGELVDVSVERNGIVIRPHEATLAELLSRVNGPPPSMEWDFVEPKGSDVW